MLLDRLREGDFVLAYAGLATFGPFGLPQLVLRALLSVLDFRSRAAYAFGGDARAWDSRPTARLFDVVDGSDVALEQLKIILPDRPWRPQPEMALEAELQALVHRTPGGAFDGRSHCALTH